MVLGSTQPLTEMSTRCISWGKADRCVRLTTLPPSCAVVMKSGNLNFLEPSGPLQVCNGTALPLPLTRMHVIWRQKLLHCYKIRRFWGQEWLIFYKNARFCVNKDLSVTKMHVIWCQKGLVSYKNIHYILWIRTCLLQEDTHYYY